MGRHIQKSNGKLAGSVGEGAKNVPSAAPGALRRETDTLSPASQPRLLSERPLAEKYNDEIASRYKDVTWEELVENNRESLVEDAGYAPEDAVNEAEYAALGVDNTLPVEVRIGRDPHGGEYTYVRNYLTYGGPTTYMDIRESGAITVTTLWGSDAREDIDNRELGRDMYDHYREMFYDKFTDPVRDSDPDAT